MTDTGTDDDCRCTCHLCYRLARVDLAGVRYVGCPILLSAAVTAATKVVTSQVVPTSVMSTRLFQMQIAEQ